MHTGGMCQRALPANDSSKLRTSSALAPINAADVLNWVYGNFIGTLEQRKASTSDLCSRIRNTAVKIVEDQDGARGDWTTAFVKMPLNAFVDRIGTWEAQFCAYLDL